MGSTSRTRYPKDVPLTELEIVLLITALDGYKGEFETGRERESWLDHEKLRNKLRDLL